MRAQNSADPATGRLARWVETQAGHFDLRYWYVGIGVVYARGGTRPLGAVVAFDCGHQGFLPDGRTRKFDGWSSPRANQVDAATWVGEAAR